MRTPREPTDVKSAGFVRDFLLTKTEVQAKAGDKMKGKIDFKLEPPAGVEPATC